MKTLNYPQAKRQARKLFGANGDVTVVKQALSFFVYRVGTIIEGVFIPLGMGKNWEDAFEDAKTREKGGREAKSGRLIGNLNFMK